MIFSVWHSPASLLTFFLASLLTFFLAVFLAVFLAHLLAFWSDILLDTSSDICFWHLFWHFVWYSFCLTLFAYLLTFCLIFFLTYLLACFSTFLLASLLALSGTSSGRLSDILSGASPDSKEGHTPSAKNLPQHAQKLMQRKPLNWNLAWQGLLMDRIQFNQLKTGKYLMTYKYSGTALLSFIIAWERLLCTGGFTVKKTKIKPLEGPCLIIIIYHIQSLLFHQNHHYLA